MMRLPPYIFGIVNQLKMEARRRGEDIIDLGMGNPDLPTPKHIVHKLVEAVKNPRNHRYSASKGIYKLRLAIGDWYRRRFDVEIDPESEVVVTIGAKEGIGHLTLATLGPGDVVHVDTGYYTLPTNVRVLPDDSGVTIQGPTVSNSLGAGYANRVWPMLRWRTGAWGRPRA
jgi:alanine-synthesizing transaminase